MSAAPTAATTVPVATDPKAAEYEARFQVLVKQHELNQKVATQLKQVLSTCEIVLLCDDSGSMASPIKEENADPFAVSKTTRWLELKKLAASLIEITTAVNQKGIDIYFFNRPTLRGVTSVAGLQTVFSSAPSGGTPLCTTLQQIYSDKKSISFANLLIVVITDGEPSDGSRAQLFTVLSNKPANVHVSFAECTDQEEDMQYLDEWDGKIRNFDNTDDYREELKRVRTANGRTFKFDYNDYVIKILLATFVRWYFSLDQGGSGGANPGAPSGCCVLL